MKNNLMVFNFIALGCLLIMVTTFHIQLDTMVTEYDTYRLSKAIEYSGQMAFQYSLTSINNNMTYEDMKQYVVSPNQSLTAFEELMCLNYDISISKDNLAYIEDSIATALLACYDGYYITLMSEVTEPGTLKSNVYQFNWSPKLPYTVTTYNASDELASEIAVRFGSEKWIRVNSNDLGITVGNTYAELGSIKVSKNEGGLTSPSISLNNNIVSRLINTRITNAITQNIDHISELRGDKDYTLYIPSEQTSNGLNTIDSPSLIIILKDVDFSGQARVRNAQIVGLKVIKKVRIICYLDEWNQKRYCYETQMSDDTLRSITVLNYFDSVEEAASAGYDPDYRYIFNQINAKYNQ